MTWLGCADMGVQRFGPKKIKRISALCGVELDMVWNNQGTTHVFEARTPDDRHLYVNTRTGEVEYLPEGHGHMTSCLKPNADPPA